MAATVLSPLSVGPEPQSQRLPRWRSSPSFFFVSASFRKFLGPVLQSNLFGKELNGVKAVFQKRNEKGFGKNLIGCSDGNILYFGNRSFTRNSADYQERSLRFSRLRRVPSILPGLEAAGQGPDMPDPPFSKQQRRPGT